MDSQRWRRIEELYNAALACESEERSLVLSRADPDIRREVEEILATNGSLPDGPAVQDLPDRTVTIVAAGKRLGRYEIETRLGAGGMGEVFRARDTLLGRSVAIKTSDERFGRRFEIEARAISALNHPHICTLYDVGPNYLVMELVEGETLAARLKQGKLPIAEAMLYGAQVAEALSDAHTHGIVHRDLKPLNIMLTRHGVKVLDFGLARVLTESGITQSRVAMGTPAYMAPEQVEGSAPGAAADLFSLGLVLFEMATGRRPVPGVSLGQTLAAGCAAEIPSASRLTPGCPAEMDTLIAKLLAKDPAQRPPSAGAVARELSMLSERAAAPPPHSRLRAVAAALVLILLLAGAGGFWLYRRTEKRRWAREEVLPQATALSAERPLAALLLLREGRRILPDDKQLTDLENSTTQLVSIQSNPAGASVAIQDYAKPGDWFPLGVTPLKNVRLPKGYFRWKLSKAGQGEFISAPSTESAMQFDLAAADRRNGMAPVPAGSNIEYIDFIGWVAENLPAFEIDKYEVTNAQYQKFVDAGGYRRPEYWKEKFVEGGKELTWAQEMELFRDPTGRPGPSTWEAGHFPQGQANYPVSGVSWYESMAYAAYAGRSLPVISQWYKAAPGDLAPFAANASNFGPQGPAAVGSFAGVGPYGTYDMAGNVREWTQTDVEGSRIILGGAWSTPPYSSFDPLALPPSDRSRLNGFRTVVNRTALPASATAPLVRHVRDFSKEKPASDDVFRAYQVMYAYDRKPLNAKSGGIVEDTPDWTREKVTIDAGYGDQRLDMYLFLPKNVQPPYQTIVFFPSARVVLLKDSHVLGDMEFIDYTIKSGRALLYPIYDGTYERVKQTSGASEQLQLNIRRSKEVRRAVDYLETRRDVDASKIAYLGVSMGSAFGVIYTALEDRFRAIVFLDGGFFLLPVPRGLDQLDFAPRIKKPVLMVNGKYDFEFSPERAQEPLFRILGTPAADKRRVVLDTQHDVTEKKAALSKEVLAWLDKYLGQVN